MSKAEIWQESPGRYLTHSEMEQFKIDCPICEITTNLMKFSDHIKEDVKNILEQ